MKIDIESLNFIDQKLQNILTHLELKTGIEFTITSFYCYKNKINEKLIVCGCNLKMFNRSIADEVAFFINKHWVYDLTRPKKLCAVIRDDCSLYVNTHENTSVRIL